MTDRRTLSPRQIEVYEHVGRCLPTKEIAALLRVSPGTAKVYIARLGAKMGLSRYQMIRQFAIEETRREILGAEPGF